MRTPWHEMWGCGYGPARRLAPQTRILAGMILFAAVLTAPAGVLPGVGLIVSATVAWVAACGMPGRAARSFLRLGLAMFLPYFLLTPLLVNGPAAGPGGARLARAFAVPWDIVLHGLSGLMVATATVTALSPSDLRSGLLALPVPRIMAAVLLQIVQQTAALLAETGRIAAALAVRGGSGKLKAGMLVLASLPRVWLPRLIDRAERVAAAMEIRGYVDVDLRLLGRERARVADFAASIAALAIAGLAAVLRWGRVG